MRLALLSTVLMFSDPSCGGKATFSVQNTVRIRNNNIVVMGKFCISSGMITILNEPLTQGVRRAITGRPLHVQSVMPAVQQLESRRLCGSSRFLPSYSTYV